MKQPKDKHYNPKKHKASKESFSTLDDVTSGYEKSQLLTLDFPFSDHVPLKFGSPVSDVAGQRFMLDVVSHNVSYQLRTISKASGHANNPWNMQESNNAYQLRLKQSVDMHTNTSQPHVFCIQEAGDFGAHLNKKGYVEFGDGKDAKIFVRNDISCQPVDLKSAYLRSTESIRQDLYKKFKIDGLVASLNTLNAQLAGLGKPALPDPYEQQRADIKANQSRILDTKCSVVTTSGEKKEVTLRVLKRHLDHDSNQKNTYGEWGPLFDMNPQRILATLITHFNPPIMVYSCHGWGYFDDTSSKKQALLERFIKHCIEENKKLGYKTLFMGDVNSHQTRDEDLRHHEIPVQNTSLGSNYLDRVRYNVEDFKRTNGGQEPMGDDLRNMCSQARRQTQFRTEKRDAIFTDLSYATVQYEAISIGKNGSQEMSAQEQQFAGSKYQGRAIQLKKVIATLNTRVESLRSANNQTLVGVTYKNIESQIDPATQFALSINPGGLYNSVLKGRDTFIDRVLVDEIERRMSQSIVALLKKWKLSFDDFVTLVTEARGGNPPVRKPGLQLYIASQIHSISTLSPSAPPLASSMGLAVVGSGSGANSRADVMQKLHRYAGFSHEFQRHNQVDGILTGRVKEKKHYLGMRTHRISDRLVNVVRNTMSKSIQS